MATKEALLKLQKLISLIENTDKKLKNLGNSLKQTRAEIDSVFSDLDRENTAMLAESTIGDETEFDLPHAPLKKNTISIFLDGAEVDPSYYEIDYKVGKVYPTNNIPEGRKLTAKYTILGLKSQASSLLDVMPSIEIAYFEEKKNDYQTAIDWIESR